jgi:hypothetical protein
MIASKVIIVGLILCYLCLLGAVIDLVNRIEPINIKKNHIFLPEQLEHVYHSSASIFTYYDHFVASKMNGFEPTYKFLTVPSAEIISRKEGSAGFRYYSGDLMDDSFQLLRGLLPTNKIFPSISMFKTLTGHVWLSEANVTATLHYDAVNNMFIQLYGTKTILLYPPSATACLMVYGKFHPYACQSRRDQICPTAAAGVGGNRSPYVITQGKHEQSSFDYCHECPDVDRNQAITIELHAGDTLVIPPYWFHKVSSGAPNHCAKCLTVPFDGRRSLKQCLYRFRFGGKLKFRLFSTISSPRRVRWWGVTTARD